MWYELLVAQELFRRISLKGEDFSEQLNFWRSREHEIDFIDDPCSWIKVKPGNISPHEFIFLKQDFPNIKLTAICRNKLPDHLGIRCLTMEEFLSEVD